MPSKDQSSERELAVQPRRQIERRYEKHQQMSEMWLY
jgi:hypothetical protein